MAVTVAPRGVYTIASGVGSVWTRGSMNALYWSMADNGGDLTAACQLVQSANPAQADIDAMTASLAVAGGKHYVLIDERTIQVNTTTYPYTYFPTLSADVSSAKAGDTVTDAVLLGLG